MGQSAAQTVEEIERIRTELDRDIQELQTRLPQPVVWAKRAVGVAVGGGLGGTALWMLVRRRRKRRQAGGLDRLQHVVLVPLEALERVRATGADGAAPDAGRGRGGRSIGMMLGAAAAAGVFAGMRIAGSTGRGRGGSGS